MPLSNERRPNIDCQLSHTLENVHLLDAPRGPTESVDHSGLMAQNTISASTSQMLHGGMGYATVSPMEVRDARASDFNENRSPYDFR